jgi:hypothetical protein
MTNVRILQNICGPGIDYRPNDVLSVADGAATDLVAAHQAILEGPSPSGVIATLYSGAGYTEVTPDPSGYIIDGSHVDDLTGSQKGFYMPENYQIVVCFPGKTQVKLDILKLRPVVEVR